MSGLFAGTPLERPVTCAVCGQPFEACACPRDDRGRVLLPREQRATVRKEKRRKGKIVTVVIGLDPCASDLPALLGELKGRCGAGGTVADGTIEIQGDHRERVAEFLREKGYPAKAV